MLRCFLRPAQSFVVCMVLAGVAMAAPPSYSFFSVASPGDPAFTQLLGINNSSTIAGYFGDGTMIPNNGFTLTLPSSFTPENFPTAVQTQVIGINNTGWTDGFYVDNTMAALTHGFTYNGTTYTTVDAPGTMFNQLLGINNGLTAVGYSSTDPTGMIGQMSFKESGGAFTYITGFAVGTGNNQAVGINNADIAVGFYQDSTGAFHGYIAPGTTANPFDVSFAGAQGTQAFGINNNGEIVGDYTDSTGTMHGFVYIGGTFYTVDDPAGVAGSTIINGVNDLGQLVGFYADVNDNVIGFVATPTPEPGSLILLGSGMLTGLGFLRRKLMR
jgi:probable HAF family extracellular repeat protein